MNASLDRRKENIEAIAAVSPLQQGILFHSLRSREHDPYFYQIVFSLTGKLDEALLERAWQLAVERHQVLRAEYRWEETATPLQVIFKSRKVELSRLDLRGHPEAEQLGRLRALLGEERQQGYDFRHASGVRLRLVQVREGVHWLSWSYHHVTLDGWSMALILGDVFGFYQRLERGEEIAAPAPLPYTVYLAWLHGQDQTQALQYWKGLLAGFDAATALPRSGSGGPVAYAERVLCLGSAETDLLHQSARGLGVTLNTLVQGAWALLLGRHAGAAEVVFGSTVSGRALELPGIEAAAGLFINTLPIRVRLESSAALDTWLARLQQQNVDSRRYEHTPLVEIRRAAGIAGDAGLFDSVVVFDNYPVDEVLERQPASLRVAPIRLFAEDLAAGAGRNNYALTLNVVLGSRITLTLAYRSDQFRAERIEELAAQLGSLLLRIARAPAERLGNLGLVPESPPPVPERPGAAPLLLEAFTEHVRRTPHALALCSERGDYDFAELDRVSNQIAALLAREGAGTDDRVALCAERSREFVALLLGILKCGAAYVPLDSKLPAARLADLTRESGARWLLASEAALPVARTAGGGAGVPVFSLAEASAAPADALAVRSIHSEQAAYVIFTSGSTGRPKGVVVSHGALARYALGLLARLELTANSSLAMVSTIAADLGHTVLFGALVAGAPLHLISEERAFDPDAFAEYMARHQVGVLKIVPSHLKALLNASDPARALPKQALIVGGEATDWPLVDLVRKLAPGCRLINHYGPTETTVGVSTFELGELRPEAQTLPIGRALPDVQLQVLDRDLNDVPAGSAGELYIAGARLGRGYLGSPGLTAERFLPDPRADGGRRYRTGDLVRRSSSGDTEFLGRVDRQVKIRGYRIELGEIEARLLQDAAVKEAVVLTAASSGGTLQLVAYVVAAEATPATRAALPGALLQKLAGSLPDYMLPARIVLLGEMPLTPNGKLDRGALPLYEAPVAAPETEPGTPAEGHLIDVWKEVLRIDQVGLDDNFFRLGGDSILSLQVIARARRRGLRITPKQLFEQPTLRALARVAALLPEAERKPAAAPAAVLAARELPLLPLQARFFEQRLPDARGYTQSVLLRSTEPLVPRILEDALQALVRQHQALQLRFQEAQPGEWRQRHPGGNAAAAVQALLWCRTAAAASALDALLEEARASLDWAQGPLLRGVWIELGPNERRLLLVAHHLVVDGVSWRVLLEDLETAYRQAARGEPITLPAPTTSPGEWAERLAEYARGEALRAELPYWLAQLAEAARAGERPELPQFPRQSAGAHWQREAIELTRDQTRELLAEAPGAYRTEVNDLLLTALGRALCAESGQTSVALLLEGHGREDLFEDIDLSRTLGWLTSAFPLRLRPRSGNWGDSIKAVKEQLRKLPQHGIGYGLLKYCADAEARAQLTGRAEPSVTFNYLGQLDQSFEPDSLFAPVDSGADGADLEQSSRQRGALTGSLGIEARVYGGQLLVDFHYDRDCVEPSAVQALAGRYRSELEALLEHTTSGAHGATPSDFPLIGFSQEQLDGLNLLWHDVQDLYPLSPMQEGLLLHTLLEPGSGIYLMQHDHRIEDALDVAAFRRAWQHVAATHDVLRTSFVWNEQGMLQVVHRAAEAEVEYLDLRSLPAERQERALAELLQQELDRGFDLGRAPLWRVRLVQTGERSFRFVFSNHHILMDAWSRAQLLQDVFVAYSAFERGAAPPREPRAPFRNFIAWLEGRQSERAVAYFRELLAGFEQATPLPSDRPIGRRTGLSTMGDVALFLSAAQTQLLEALARQHELTLNTFVQAAWVLTLVRYSGLEDVLFGVTVAGRPVELPEMETAIGLFINSIPLRVRLPARHTPTRDWLRALLQQNVELRQHEHLPLVTIQANSDLSRGQALFHGLFVFENAPVDIELIESAEHLSASAIGGRTHTNYPLTVVIYPGSRLGLHLSFDRRCFEPATAAAMLGEFERLLLELARGFDAPLDSLGILPEGDRARLLGAWNDTQHAYPFEEGYAPLFENRVRRHPDRIAVSCRDEALSFAALNSRANRVAHVLGRCGAALDAPVALLAQRGLELLCGLLGSLKAGAAYLPLDPKHPPRRIAEVLRQARPRVLLTLPAFRGLLAEALSGLPAELRPEVVMLDGAEVCAAPAQNPLARAGARSLAYVIFTSGSTGVPKGVMVEHAGMLNNQLSKLPWFGLSERDVIAQTASQCFDISVWQFLTALLCGARTEIICDEIAHDPAALLEQVRRSGVSILESVPSLIQGFLESDERELPGLRWLLSTGEALSPALARRWVERHPQVSLANAYGPAECSDDVSLCRIDTSLPEHTGFVPIGTPTDNNQLYVLDAQLELLPVGVIGEVCIGGTGVGRGYLSDPRRTAEVFVPHPYARAPGERLYRSGDLGRYRSDGVLECVGRRDQQVKVRGYRIELGEVEACLREHPAVGEAVVLASPVGDGKRLVGYVSVRGDLDTPAAAELVDELLRQLRDRLPDYMLPAQLLVLEALPRTANGKLDRKALPEPDWGERGSYVAPQSELARSLAEIWQRVLGVARVGEHDNFFERGGDSLLAARVISRVRQDLKLSVPLRVMFETQSLGELERAVRAEGRRLETRHGWGS